MIKKIINFIKGLFSKKPVIKAKKKSVAKKK